MSTNSRIRGYGWYVLALVGVSLAGWFGQGLVDGGVAAGDSGHSAKSAGNQTGSVDAVRIDLPPPLPSAAELAETDGSQKAAGTAKVAKSPASEPAIVAGGVVEGAAVDRMWETNANMAWQTRSQPLTPPNWYITGVVQRGSETQIIVRFDNDPVPRFFKVGDTLPGGGKLSWVRPDAIGVVTPNHKKIDVPVLAGEWSRTQAASAPAR